LNAPTAELGASPRRAFFSTSGNLSPFAGAGHIFWIFIFQTIVMLHTFHNCKAEHISDVNNFLKNEAEIMTDFKIRLSNTIKEIDILQARPHITYNRIINKMSEAECSGFLSEQSLFMEENY
jgi:hypothetical protein